MGILNESKNSQKCNQWIISFKKIMAINIEKKKKEKKYEIHGSWWFFNDDS